MRHISADYIFPIFALPIKNGIVTIDDDGTILDVSSEHEFHDPTAKVERYEGIICPGFVNTHCHLELSYLHEQITEKAEMTGFIKQFVAKRNTFSEQDVQKAIEKAEAEMIKNGIVAVGDISNNNSTFAQKAKGNLIYHTFVEVFGMDERKAEDVFNKGLELINELQQLEETLDIKLHASLVPHAPYTISEKLLMLLNQEAMQNNSLISIHNQESETESELFISHSGKMFDSFKAMGMDVSMIRKTGVNSLRSTLPFFKDVSKILLVHNTFTSLEDIKYIKAEAAKWKSEIYFSTCPSANLYIENALPHYPYFVDEDVHLTIGTDSLASNHHLSILNELKVITEHYPFIDLQTLLKWATKNGADFLRLNKLGSIEKGKKPGLNLLRNVDLENLHITEFTEVQKLI